MKHLLEKGLLALAMQIGMELERPSVLVDKEVIPKGTYAMIYPISKQHVPLSLACKFHDNIE